MSIYNLDTAIQYSSPVLTNGVQASNYCSRLHACFGINNGPNQYLQLHDTASVPANGAVPVFSMVIFTGANFYLTRDALPWKFSRGIYICNSTTLATKTLGAADCWIQAQYLPTE